MLVQVVIENFLSFKEETTFSMLGVQSDLNHVEHLAVDIAGKESTSACCCYLWCKCSRQV